MEAPEQRWRSDSVIKHQILGLSRLAVRRSLEGFCFAIRTAATCRGSRNWPRRRSVTSISILPPSRCIREEQTREGRRELFPQYDRSVTVKAVGWLTKSRHARDPTSSLCLSACAEASEPLT